jgi:Protein of unknown function (DUF3551)
MKRMRAAKILLAVCALTLIGERPSGAQAQRPWCVVYSGRDGAYTCIFASFEQCQMTATPGTGGMCVQNPWYSQPAPNGPSTTGQGGRPTR